MDGKIAVRKLSKLEAARKQYQDWLRTGQNPPPAFAGVTEAQRQALYKQTLLYQAHLEGRKEAGSDQEQTGTRIRRLLVNGS